MTMFGASIWMVLFGGIGIMVGLFLALRLIQKAIEYVVARGLHW